jgi:crotonobetainyl-CoA:carnitine CoA-transferase CaiB-like acyl-CoA transferase
MAVRMLADMGAEAIVIDAPQARLVDRQYLDMLKRLHAEGRHFPYFPEGDPGDEPWNRQGSYNDFNRNKLGITLNLAVEAGRDLFKRLVKISDIVLENFTPRVMKNFGLDYPVLSQINPRIIMVSLPGYGMYGPYRDYPAYGTTLEQHAGFSSVMGYPDSGPYRTQSTYADPVASVNAAGAMMLALWHRRRTGKGQYIDLAQIESSICLLGEVVLDYSMNGRNPRRLGNGHAWMAPHGCYRCKGDDKWVSIAVANDDEWRSLCKAIGRPAWVDAPRFASQMGRWENQAELDRLLQSWTILHGHHEVMKVLQAAGVAAGAVLNARELIDDEQLVERGYFVRQEHRAAGVRPYPGLPIKFSRTPPRYGRAAPCVDEHQDYVFGKLLGLSKKEIKDLFDAEVIGNRMKEAAG